MQRAFLGKRFGCCDMRVETSSIFAFARAFLEKRKFTANPVRSRTSSAWRKADGECLSRLYQFRESGYANPIRSGFLRVGEPHEYCALHRIRLRHRSGDRHGPLGGLSTQADFAGLRLI